MSAVPYMKFYIGDYLGDTQHLTTLQHGAYLLLIMAYWQRRGPLPMDDDKLARIARCAIAEWMQCKCDVLAFFEVRDGMLYHNRIERELQGIADISEKRRGAAHKKWDTLPEGDANALQEDSKCIANGMLSHIHIPYSNSDLIPEKEEEPFYEKPKDDKFARIEAARAIWNEAMPKKPYRYTALNMGAQVQSECLRPMAVYSDDEIGEAIRNYARILESPEHEIKSPFESFHGFMKTGIEKFDSAADPWNTYKKRRMKSYQDQENEDRAKILEELNGGKA